MDWNLFWNAFGGISTFVGSIVTIITVIVAYNQLMQPARKIIQINYLGTYGGGSISEDPLLVSVSYLNLGLRNVNLKSFGIIINKKYYNLTGVTYDLVINEQRDVVNLLITPENYLNVFYEKDVLLEVLRDNNKKKKNKIFYFSAIDIHGEKYNSKKVKIKEIEDLIDDDYFSSLEED